MSETASGLIRLLIAFAPGIYRAYKDSVVPLSKAIIDRDGKSVESIYVPKGTIVYVGMLACNRNPELWGPDANEWKPERWLSDPVSGSGKGGLPESLLEAKVPGIYSHLMTFLGGPRACM